MKRLLILPGILLAGAAAYGILSGKQGEPMRRLSAKMRERMKSHMGRMMEKMPEDSPPRLVMTTLPRLEEQNDQILALLREQNALLRDLSAKRDQVSRF